MSLGQGFRAGASLAVTPLLLPGPEPPSPGTQRCSQHPQLPAMLRGCPALRRARLRCVLDAALRSLAAGPSLQQR